LLKPPYGRITAYNMNTGDIAWQVPNGATTPQNISAIFTKLGLTNVPPTGIPSQAGLLVTKTLLFGTEGGGGRPLLHAYDKRTGENLAEVTMPANSSSVPMSYMYQGRQFVVLAVGGQPAGQLVAFALPVQGQGGAAGGGRGTGAPGGAGGGRGAGAPGGAVGGRGAGGAGAGGRGVGGGAPAQP
jgi:glucose dehydrogenase